MVLERLESRKLKLRGVIKPYFQLERIWYNNMTGATHGLDI